MTQEIILTNALIVTPDEAFIGSLVMENGVIKDVDTGISRTLESQNLEGDLLLPGLIELHTDNLESFLMPRPKVRWPSALTALLAHDSLISAAGITTVLDSVFLGASDPVSPRPHLIEESLKAMDQGRKLDVTRAEHLLHLRCELPDEDLWPLFQKYYQNPLLRLVSLNDHTPGQRQWRDMDTFRAYHRADHMSEEKMQLVIERRMELQRKNLAVNKKRVLDLCHEIKVPLASHDDATEEQILEAVEAGVTITEFPTTVEAAKKSREKGLKNICGGPNLVRGQSHSANVSARELAAADLLDAISSDYYPAGLMESVFTLIDHLDYDLPRAVSTVTANPADMVGLSDRGRLLPGYKSDVVQVKRHRDMPLVIHVWQGGRRKF